MGIYNFTRNIDAVAYLIDNPNSYKDVAQFHMIGGAAPMAAQNNQMSQSQNNGGKGTFGFNQPNNEQAFVNSSAMMPSMGATRVIGIKGLTEHAGATTLIYMLKKQLSEHYNVLGLELDKNDFLYFNDPDLKSVSSKELSTIINNPINNYNVILIDINSSSEEANCSEMIYLIEPSTLRLNKMIRRDRAILSKMRSMKVVLNMSLLDSSDIKDFEGEAGCSVFHNVPPLDDKKDRHRVLDELLNKLGFDKNKPVGDGNKPVRLFGIVKE
jgi:hypothetical protein